MIRGCAVGFLLNSKYYGHEVPRDCLSFVLSKVVIAHPQILCHMVDKLGTTRKVEGMSKLGGIYSLFLCKLPHHDVSGLEFLFS